MYKSPMLCINPSPNTDIKSELRLANTYAWFISEMNSYHKLILPNNLSLLNICIVNLLRSQHVD